MLMVNTVDSALRLKNNDATYRDTTAVINIDRLAIITGNNLPAADKILSIGRRSIMANTFNVMILAIVPAGAHSLPKIYGKATGEINAIPAMLTRVASCKTSR